MSFIVFQKETRQTYHNQLWNIHLSWVSSSLIPAKYPYVIIHETDNLILKFCQSKKVNWFLVEIYSFVWQNSLNKATCLCWPKQIYQHQSHIEGFFLFFFFFFLNWIFFFYLSSCSSFHSNASSNLLVFHQSTSTLYNFHWSCLVLNKKRKPKQTSFSVSVFLFVCSLKILWW